MFVPNVNEREPLCLDQYCLGQLSNFSYSVQTTYFVDLL